MMLHGCRIAPLSSDTCHSIVASIVESRVSLPLMNQSWALAHCTDGVAWGRHDGNVWRFSASAFPDVAPVITLANLQEIRFFGKEEELLIWRESDTFLGRVLAEADGIVVPLDVSRVLVGDRILQEPRDGFTVVGDGAGSVHCPPITCTAESFTNRRWPLRLLVRNYFKEDPSTGAMRIAASRLVDLVMYTEGS